MNLNVNYEELKSLSSYVNTKYEEINKVFDDISKLVDDIEKNWQGNDADVFVAKARHYIEKEKKTNEKIKDISIILDKVSQKYEGTDKEFYEKMNKESVRDGE
jgi:WXG100 family type VII secretion target